MLHIPAAVVGGFAPTVGFFVGTYLYKEYLIGDAEKERYREAAKRHPGMTVTEETD